MFFKLRLRLAYYYKYETCDCWFYLWYNYICWCGFVLAFSGEFIIISVTSIVLI